MIRLIKMMDRKKLFLIITLIFLEVAGFLLLPTLAADILNASALSDNVQRVNMIGGMMLIVNVLTIGLAFASVYFTAKETQGLGNRLRKMIFDRVMNWSREDMTEFGTSTLITRTTNDIMQLQMVTMMMLRMIIISPVVMIVSTFFAYQRESQLAWVFTITLPLILIAVALIFKKASPIFKTIQSKLDRLNQVFREGLTGIRVIRAFNTTKIENERFDEANRDYRDTAIRAFTILNLMLPVMLFMVGLSNVLIFTNGTTLIANNQMQVGDLIAFVQYGVQILMSVLQVSMLLFFIPRSEVSAERVFEVIDKAPSIIDPENPKTIPATTDLNLRFKDVDFGFPNAERPAVEGIDFKVNKGETLAIIGGTGSGKTTIANIIPRLYEVTNGEVLLNGVDIREITQADLRHRIGYAPQNARLFSGTIRSNMQYGKEDATDEEIWHALEVAQGDFVKTLEEGLDSRVEQGGTNFSGGQRQRLSIARAIVAKPDIYIFDDSFSALDFKTDANLRAALKPETKDSISIIIAQRVNTVVNADQILVLENGSIAGQGTHKELLENNEVYRDIVESQMKGDEI